MTLSPRSFLLIATLAAGSVLAGAWAYTSAMRMRFLETGYPIWVAKQTILHRCDFGSVLVLGDSRAEAAIVPTPLPLRAANITFGGTTPIETYFFAREAMKCPQPPRLVIYSHSMPAFLRPGQGLWKTAARYGYIHFADLREVAAMADAIHDESFASLNTSDGLTGVVRDITYAAGFPSIFVPSLVEARAIGRYETNRMLLERTASTRGRVIYPQPADKQLVGIDAGETEFVPSPLETAYLDKTLNLFAAAHVRVILLTVPVAQSTNRAIRPAVKAGFSRFLAGYGKRYENVTLSPDGLIGWPDDFYIDGSHMNPRGAEAFTAKLADCLRQASAAPDRSPACDFDWK
jgi:hypothetical protein